MEILPQLAGLGGGGVFVALIVYFLAGIRADRKSHVELIDAANRRADEAYEKRRAAIEAEDQIRQQLREAQDTVAELSREIYLLQSKLDETDGAE